MKEVIAIIRPEKWQATQEAVAALGAEHFSRQRVLGRGRVCGPAAEFLLGWKTDSVRPPVFPVRIGSMANLAGD